MRVSGIVVLAFLPLACFGVEFTFAIPPTPVTVDLGGQPVAVTISGDVSGSPMQPGPGGQSFDLSLRADLGEFQSHLTQLLQAKLNKSDRCGDRVSIVNATLAPAAPAANMAVRVHFERRLCVSALGNTAKKLLGGDATVHVILTPRLENSATVGQVGQNASQTVRLDAEIGAIDAEGPLGNLLRSGTIGPALRERVRETLLSAMQKSTDMQTVVPEQVARFVTIQKIGFADKGSGRLELDVAGRIQVPGELVSLLLEQLSNRN